MTPSTPKRRAPQRLRTTRKPPLSLTQILAWADAHFERTGHWPGQDSGLVGDAFDTRWKAIDKALREGLRGLPGGASLAKLLAERRGVRNRGALPHFTEAKILEWTDAHHLRTGEWPKVQSGPIADAPGETWLAVDSALRAGKRGLEGGSSLAQVLTERRGVRNEMGLPPLATEQVLAWADDFVERTGRFPSNLSGPVGLAPGETWGNIDNALRTGLRGFSGGSSLSRLLADARNKRHPRRLPRLRIETILVWADAHRAHDGKFPDLDSGPVEAAPGETWCGIDQSLRYGRRGLPGRWSLARLLARRRGVRNRFAELPPLSIDWILAWADAYHARQRRWPTQTSGAIQGVPHETWSGVDDALYLGLRGLPGGSSLARLLAAHRGKRHIHELPPLSIEQILAWADAHFARTGSWPNINSGAIVEAPSESWKNIRSSLIKGRRGLPGGKSLAKLLEGHRRCLPALSP